VIGGHKATDPCDFVSTILKDSRVAEETVLIWGLPCKKACFPLWKQAFFMFVNLIKANNPKGLDAKPLA
jgi:hypothetical protein